MPSWRWFLLVALVTFGVFAPTIGNDWVDWDDNYNFEVNPHYKGLGADNLQWMFTAYHQGHYHPLSWVTLGVDYVLWGMNAHGYHLTNVLLHAASAGLFAWVAALLFRERRSAAAPAAGGATGDGFGVAFGCAAALLWSLHPLRVEAVSWITQRREVLCGFFTLLALASHLRGRPRWHTAVFSLLAMLSKATAVTIPVIVVLIDVHREGGLGAPGWFRAAWRAVLRHWVLVAMAAWTSYQAILAQREASAMVAADDLPFGSRLGLFFYGAFFYAEKTLVPAGLAPLHAGQVGATWTFRPYVWREAAIGAGLAVAAAAAGWALRRRAPAAILFLAAYLIMLMPVGGLGQSGRQIVGERYAYQLGWVLTLAAALPAAAWIERRGLAPRRVAVALAALLAVLGWATVRQQGFWAGSEELWNREVDVHPDDPVGNANLGVWYERRPHGDHADQDFAKAEHYLRRSIEIVPDYLTPHLKLAEVLQLARRPEEAVAEYAMLIERNPVNTNGHMAALAKIAPLHWAAGRKDAALAALAQWEKAEPKNLQVFTQEAKAQAAAGRPRDAIATYERGIEATGSASLWAELAWLLATNPDPAVRNGRRALECAERAWRARPRTALTIRAFAAACAEAGEFDRAVRELTAAMPEAPEFAAAMEGMTGDLRQHAPPPRIEPAYP